MYDIERRFGPAPVPPPSVHALAWQFAVVVAIVTAVRPSQACVHGAISAQYVGAIALGSVLASLALHSATQRGWTDAMMRSLRVSN